MNGASAAAPKSNAFGLAIFMAMVVMLFVSFTAALLVRRAAPDWTSIPLPSLIWAGTAVLLVSSAAAEVARRTGSRRWLGAAAAVGVVFAAGQALAWRQLAAEGVFLTTSPHASFFFMLTAVHAVHVVAGLTGLLVSLLRNRGAGLAVAFWHFLGGLWLYIVLVLSVL